MKTSCLTFALHSTPGARSITCRASLVRRE
jgi:hypothetical protein